MAVDLGLVSIYNTMMEISGSITLGAGASDIKEVAFANATEFFESYINCGAGLECEVMVSGTSIMLLFTNTTNKQLSASYNVRIGFSGG